MAPVAPHSIVVSGKREYEDFSVFDHDAVMQDHLIGIILWTSSTVYGAVHLAGWNEQFPTVPGRTSSSADCCGLGSI